MKCLYKITSNKKFMTQDRKLHTNDKDIKQLTKKSLRMRKSVVFITLFFFFLPGLIKYYFLVKHHFNLTNMRS